MYPFEAHFARAASARGPASEPIIDAQYSSNALYVAPSAVGKMFGVNFADDRIKGYGLTMPDGNAEFKLYVCCARNTGAYGMNSFTDNGYSPITKSATGLMWAQNDSGTGLNWEEALAWVETQNAANYLGYDDWRLPNVKELQSIIDYGRSPDTTGSASIDPRFNATAITNEAGQTDYPFLNVLHVLTTEQRAELVALAEGQVAAINQYATDRQRFPVWCQSLADAVDHGGHPWLDFSG